MSSAPLRVQVLSDIHLEKWSGKELKYPPTLDADVLILAGDIGNPRAALYYDFIKMCAGEVKYVIVVAGNHEYYGSTIEKTDELIKTLFAEDDNIWFLQNEGVEIEGLWFYGTTLWSNIPSKDFWSCVDEISDYKRIEYFRPSTCNLLNETAFDALKKFVDEHPATIVITHHAPMCLDGEHHSAFHNHYGSYIIKNSNKIPLWIYGHTHKHKNTTIENTAVASNPRGYKNELMKSKYWPAKMIFNLSLE